MMNRKENELKLLEIESIENLESILNRYDSISKKRIIELLIEIKSINKSDEYYRLKYYQLMIHKIRLLNDIFNNRYL